MGGVLTYIRMGGQWLLRVPLITVSPQGGFDALFSYFRTLFPQFNWQNMILLR